MLIKQSIYLKFLISDTNVLFSLLNGESFDYIGSSRLVYDLEGGKLHVMGSKVLKLSDIEYVIELGQLGGNKLYLHTNNLQNSSLIKSLESQLSATVAQDSYPPASIQSFLKVNSSMKTVVIANHGKQFVNKYYNGIWDDAAGLGYSL